MALTEIWKDVVGYEGLYQVSNLGRVKSFHRKEPCILKPMMNHKGYLRVELHNAGFAEMRSVHNLVKCAFDPLRDYGVNLQINHKDGDKTNNRIDNLEWCTGSQNVRHAFETGLKVPVKGEQHGMCKLTDDEVREIKTRYKRGDSEFGSYALAKRFGVHSTTIQKIVKGKFRRSVTVND